VDFREFKRSGHWPSLLCAFLYFDLSFMLWTLIGALGVFIAQAFHLSPAQKGLLVAIPLLGGSILRVVLGIASDHFGPRRVGIAGLTLTLVPLIWAWQYSASLADMWGIGLLLGVAGASFAVALPLASQWYPPHFQGLVLGIAGAVIQVRSYPSSSPRGWLSILDGARSSVWRSRHCLWCYWSMHC
jgi:NNP family nitrate/nitrite transporter-like MFS transporter